MNPAPTTTAFFNLDLFPFRKSFILKACSAWDKVNTFSKFSEYPAIFGTNDFAPTAITNLS